MISASEVREDDESYMNPIDRLFEALEKKHPTVCRETVQNTSLQQEKQQEAFSSHVVQDNSFDIEELGN